MDNKTTVKELRDKIAAFVTERDWMQFHTPKDLALAMSIEVGEILEHFRFKTREEVLVHINNSENKKELSHEIADAFFFLLQLANVCDIDLTTAFHSKLAVSAQKYPVEKVKGKPYKYTHYQK